MDYEKEILEYWEDNKIYEKVKDKNKDGELFDVVDGPPYPTGEVHLGHGRNWAIKDAILRFKRLQGYNVYARDGYDVHGLPVENKTQSRLGLKTVQQIREFGVENFVEECKKYVSEIIDSMNFMRNRYGLWMDRDYYYTAHPDYISMSWRFFKEAHKRGLLYKQNKVVGWCPKDQTTLSDYEIKDSYAELVDPSIFVKFEIEYHKTGKGVGIVIENERGEILIADRNEAGREKSVGIIGGKYEDKDGDILGTVKRECLEEIGVVPEKIEIIGSSIDVFEGWVFHTYHARAFLPSSTKFDVDDSLKNLRWVKKEQIPWDRLHIPTKNVLLDVLDMKKFPKLGDSIKTYLLIWTTTPWTLQSNLAVAVNPKYEYATVYVRYKDKEEAYVIAKELVDKVLELAKKSNDIEDYKIIDTFLGKELEGVKYKHPYLGINKAQDQFREERENNPYIHSVILGDFVTLGERSILDELEKKGYKHSLGETGKEKKSGSRSKEGTGLVHIAPGHGFDDYEVGIKYKLPIYCPVGEDGRFVEGLYKGEYFSDVNDKVIEDLNERGLLLYATTKKHRYPLCWRCKTPIVYRAAEQWWIKRSTYIGDIIKENKNVKWFPKYAAVQFENLMKNAGDWPISRQRFWGIPLPIWECDNCGRYEVIGSREELEEKTSVKFDDLHMDYLKDVEFRCECGGTKKIVPYIADVWFDSGCASFASHYGEGLSFDEIIKQYYPIKFITEGEDQMRGWFSSLFNVGYVVTGKAPYREVLFYKYVMDKEGRKMSKSLGNGITLNEAIEQWGADVVRYYLLTKRLPEEQINFDPDEIKEVKGFFNTLSNVIKFMNEYLKEYKGTKCTLTYENMDIEDRWILYEFNKVIGKVILELENYRLSTGFKMLESFVLREVSRMYLKLVKDRAEEYNESLLGTFESLVRGILVAFSPAIPFLTEYLYINSSLRNKKTSIFLESYPSVDPYMEEYGSKDKISEVFEVAFSVIQASLNAREKARLGVRWPIPKMFILKEDLEKKDFLKIEKIIKKVVNVKEILLNEGLEYDIRLKPNFKAIKEDFFDSTGEVIKLINENSDEITGHIKRGNKMFKVGNFEIDLEKHIIIDMILEDYYKVSEIEKGGKVVIDTRLDDILLEEGYIREIVRRIQQMRKDNGLVKKDEVVVSFAGSDRYILKLVELWKTYLKSRVNAVEVVDDDLGNKKFTIRDKIIMIGIRKV